MKRNRIFPILTALALLVLPACFHDNNDAVDYSEWRELNTKAFNDSMLLENEYGELVYTVYTPNWDPSFSILLKWDEESEDPSEVRPLSTSTCHVKYTLSNVDGETLDSSANFTCVPNQMVTGFMAALSQMRVNDSITTVLPYTAGYGVYGYGGIPPYSTLVFGIRLDSISRLM